MNTVSISTLLVCVFAASGGAHAADAQSLEVEGFAAVVNNDVPIARDRAIDDAKRKAVEQIAGSQVSGESITENFQLVQDRIYARASGFVRSYQVVSEVREGDTYRIKIKAMVDAHAIAEDLSQIFKDKPRVIVMIAEQNIGGNELSYWWGSSGFASEMDLTQTALINQWQPHGFKFIDPGMLRGKLKVQKAMQSPTLSDQDAITLSKGADADVALVGKVLVSDAGPVMEGEKMRSYHAVGTIRVLNVDTGEIIAVADETGVAPHIDPNMGGRLAIKALAQKLGGDLEKKILTRWTAEAASSRELEVTASGVKDTKMLRELQRVLETEIRGVEKVVVRRLSKERAFITVKVRSAAMDFGHDLESKSFKGFEVKLRGVSGGKVNVELTNGKS